MLVEQALRALAHRRAELALGTIDQFTQQIDQVNDVVGVPFAFGLAGAAVRCPVIGHLATSSNVFASIRGHCFTMGSAHHHQCEKCQELIALDPGVFFAGEPSAARAAKALSPELPIVCPVLTDSLPDLFASYARPGGSVTGLAASLEGLHA